MTLIVRKILITGVIIAGFFGIAHARENATDWYIKNFHSNIVINTDSSLTITETIIADCGSCYNKHGIFRVVPTQINTTDQGIIKTPVALISIMSESEVPYHYQESTGSGTITWKIGDPDITVTGVHVYKIVYQVKNAVRAQRDFDELYWNLNGNYWQLWTDVYNADIHFPQGANKSNTDISYFTGAVGQKQSDLATSQWIDDQTLYVQSTRSMMPGEGITISATFPKGTVTPYIPSFIEKYQFDVYGRYLIPFLVFLACLYIWKKYGDDPNLHKAIMAEYDPPDNLGVIPVGMLWKGGTFKNQFITAAIIQMASRGLIKITQTEKKVLFIGTKDYEFAWTGNTTDTSFLTTAENRIIATLFKSGSTIHLSEHPHLFAPILANIKKNAQEYLIDNGYMDRQSYSLQAWMGGIGAVLIFATYAFMRLLGVHIDFPIVFPVVISIVIIFIFSSFMKKLTAKGAEAQWRTKGFYLYMDMAEKYRDRFYEQENIFEKLLPYAIAFGMTKQWIKKMREIYGDQRFAAMTPIWFHSMSGTQFDADTFSSAMTAVSSSISQSVSTSSGSGGGGFSGGGGGGGGGGGW
ncbi:MAG: hypothetical protein A3A33_01755 [Candidatus Yanofskybacteria bacterium RIFCSPLOWO2_01_FULL_49_25]|uniref:DUF2207 domain-containing protein n=1 Tax=Candidatus Yanofskybacteria bacterium RIFCSPLOWO2_01_FULL_49_25 TaxID=1802701 RepID=A0A1F8GYG9_9BACT|nr:MAG: hypothetical protein A3A33_01755 [Candidatus Yanofskybacteria bacterium RIFCSPLOWO2_01_FULL_49_25]